MATIGLAFLAGVLSILSPCVLPLVPMVLGAAVSEHKWGPAALAAGLAISFTVLGLFVALFGFALGIGTDFFRIAAAILMIGIGVVLMLPKVQTRFATAAGPAANWTEMRPPCARAGSARTTTTTLSCSTGKRSRWSATVTSAAHSSRCCGRSRRSCWCTTRGCTRRCCASRASCRRGSTNVLRGRGWSFCWRRAPTRRRAPQVPPQ